MRKPDSWLRQEDELYQADLKKWLSTNRVGVPQGIKAPKKHLLGGGG